MHFLTQIEHHLKDFDTTARAEIERFLEHLKSKFVEPGVPVPSAAAPVAAPEAPVVAADPVAPVEPPPAPETPVVADPVMPVATPKVDTGAVV
jgi:hypothetical protein